jgi:hypothetical protein
LSARAQVGVAVTGIALGMLLLVISLRVALGATSSDPTDHRDATTAGSVTAVEQYPILHAGQSAPLCHVTASYVVDGVRYAATSQGMDAAYCALRRGQVVPVRYNRADPGDGDPGSKSSSTTPVLAALVPLAFAALSVGIVGGCARRIILVRRATA